MPNPTFSLLYSRTARGQIQTWQIFVKGAKYRTVEGLDGGALTTSDWTTCQAKNVGRANQTSASEQATKEATARHLKKLKAGYHEDRTLIDQDTFFEPMLAKSWEDYGAEVMYPVYSQPKLDGMRCIATKDGLFSRNGKPIVSVPHISQLLKPVFAAHPTWILDGELYVEHLKDDFNQIMSLAKKTNPTTADIAASAVLEYWVYDMYDSLIPDWVFNQRSTMVDGLHYHFADVLPSVRSVPTTFCLDQQALDDLYQAYLTAGFEGQMVRADTPYENKRTKNLLKRKTMTDWEFELIDLQPGRGGAAHHAARAILRTDNGDDFEAGIIGDHAYAADILKDKTRYIGKMATVVYQNMTPGDHPVPRFGKLKELDRTDN